MTTMLENESTYPVRENGLSSGGPILAGLSLIDHPRDDRWPLRRTFLFSVVISTLVWGAIISAAIQVF